MFPGQWGQIYQAGAGDVRGGATVASCQPLPLKHGERVYTTGQRGVGHGGRGKQGNDKDYFIGRYWILEVGSQFLPLLSASST